MTTELDYAKADEYAKRNLPGGFAFREAENLARCYEALRKENAWQPIETAPRDGTCFVIWGPDLFCDFEIGKYDPYASDSFVEVADGLFKKEKVTWSEFTHNNFHLATHWMPLPTPPDTSLGETR